jgi:hypothetical protein
MQGSISSDVQSELKEPTPHLVSVLQHDGLALRVQSCQGEDQQHDVGLQACACIAAYRTLLSSLMACSFGNPGKSYVHVRGASPASSALLAVGSAASHAKAS